MGKNQVFETYRRIDKYVNSNTSAISRHCGMYPSGINLPNRWESLFLGLTLRSRSTDRDCLTRAPIVMEALENNAVPKIWGLLSPRKIHVDRRIVIRAAGSKLRGLHQVWMIRQFLPGILTELPFCEHLAF